jgi:hypothetical protein
VLAAPVLSSNVDSDLTSDALEAYGRPRTVFYVLSRRSFYPGHLRTKGRVEKSRSFLAQKPQNQLLEIRGFSVLFYSPSNAGNRRLNPTVDFEGQLDRKDESKLGREIGGDFRLKTTPPKQAGNLALKQHPDFRVQNSSHFTRGFCMSNCRGNKDSFLAA